MEPTPTIDTWNQDLHPERLQAFVKRRLADKALAGVELTVEL